jgi:hypothetical protein
MRLFGTVSVATVGIGWNELEGAGNLIDILDASDGQEGVVLVNVAPRHGRGKKWPNGTPFGYFYYGKTLVIATIAETMLSLVKKLNVTDSLSLTDIPTVIDAMISQGHLDASLRDRIAHSQFRSYDYMPRLAKWLVDGIAIPHEAYGLENVSDVPHSVWWVDNFGNCKTTILPEEIGHADLQTIQTNVGAIRCYGRLRDVPDGEAAFIVGSSGLEDKRFIELVVQGGSAAEKFNLKSGSVLL